MSFKTKKQNKNVFQRSTIVALLFLCQYHINAQSVPSIEENIPFLVTFGKDSEKSWGDDDFCQIFFALIPKDYSGSVFIRVFDPETSGLYDENKGEFNTKINFTVYGGEECWSDKDAQATDPTGNYKSGTLLKSKTFGNAERYDGEWYTFGPFSPNEGEYVEKFNGYMFKIIAEGVAGDDGNLYRYFLSRHNSENLNIEGGNIFTYEYTFRLPNDNREVCQIYPYIDDETISVKVSNFDWDNDGKIKMVSVAKNGIHCDISGQEEWNVSEYAIVEEEKNSSLQLQFVKDHNTLIKNNNVAIVVQNQYGFSLPFYVLPIGGVPVYRPKIMMKDIRR
ncbi:MULTISPECIES: hypothetical protein [unclassified Saccharicrinis]|uniref:hypothetical protein n=1 Tax=unclassified Saccharicrinis TaxID=2646859 RepID=UPI003D333D7B